MRVTSITASKIKNSNGKNTIQVIVNKTGIGSAPSGESKGKFEAVDYPNGIDFSINLVNKTISKSLVGFQFDGFSNLKKLEVKLPSNLGANPIIALEYALLNALAHEKTMPLWKILNPKARKMPRILANVVGGGAHAPEKFRTLDIQEILLSPLTGILKKDVYGTLEFYNELAFTLQSKQTDEEGARIVNKTIEEVFETLLKVTGYERGIDIAASQLYKNGKYHWKHLWGGMPKTNDKKYQIDAITYLAREFNLFYVEDPVHQDDFEGFAELRKRLPGVMICGDDLTVTNLSRLKTAIKMKSINAIIIKPNQAGSLIKAKEVFDYAVKNGITPIISHRGGETMDATIAHIAFAWQAPFVKFGIGQKERMAKLNELIKIEKSL